MIYYQQDAFNKAKAEALTREALQKLVNDHKVTRACAEIHDALESVKRGDMTREDFEELKKSRKRSLPILCVHGTPKDGFRREKDAQGNPNMEPNGLAMADFDHIEGSPWQLYKDRIKGHEDELGILLVHVTPSREGLHVIFRRPAEGCILQAQLWMSRKVSMEVDRGCFDLARSAYLVPQDYILYLSEHLFDAAYEPLALSAEDQALYLSLSEEIAAGNRQPPAGNLPFTSPAVTISRLPSYDKDATIDGMYYHDIIQEWLRQDTDYAYRYIRQDGCLRPKEGYRANTLQRLASELRTICDDSMERVLQVVPRWGLGDKEVITNVQGGFRYPARTSSSMDKVVSTLFKAKQCQSSLEDEEQTADGENTPENTSLPSLLGRGKGVRLLPPALRASLAGVPQNMWWPVLAATLPIQAALADGVEVEYCDGARQRLALMTIVVGDQASGKSTCKQTVDIWKRILEREDADAREREDEWKQKKKNRKANERCPEDPEVMIRVLPVTVSCSTLLKRFKNSRGHTLYSFGEELDTLRKTNGAGSWSSKYDIYRLGFDHGEWGQDYNSDQAESGMVNVAYNWTMLGTYGALRKCFSKDNVENGLSSRVIVAEMPDNAFAPMPHYGRRTAHHEAIIEEAAQKLREVRGFVDTPRLRKAIGQWVEEKRLEAMAKIDRVMDTYRKRAAVIGFRAGVVCHLLSGEARETKATLDFALAVAELTLKGQMSVFGEALSDQLSDGKPTLRKDSNKTVLDQLPREFTLADLQQLKQGFASSQSLYTIISRWSKAGWVEKTDTKHWRKLESNNLTV